MDCRGQGYDGAGAVAGHINGLSAHILQINSKAIYTHCHVSASCNFQTVRNVFDKIKEISYFFNFSETRRLVLESSIAKCNTETDKTKLKDVCRTR